MKDSLTHCPSSQGWAPGVLPFFVQVFCLSPVCTWMEGWGEEGGYLLLCFFSIIYILGLVCYKHTIHVVKHKSVLIFYMQKAREPENDAGFLKHNYSHLNCSCYSYA